ncbi:MAG TPA: serine/threonine-protein kinase, partial [Candidatus Krumholzibacterium sp.]|nr:serine/threonine-protein kinase [Candidatus Krumholzibacterium sp.]
MIGKTISHYRIISLLGEGGMGEVYLAEDMKLSRKVALKFLPAGIDRDESAEKRLIREARAAASLNHPNICTIHEIDQADGRYFIVMEHVDGRSLGEMIEEGPLSIDEAVDIAMQVARGLQAAEKSGIVHRDIKPSNIMVTGGGQAKIMDFGLAKVDGSSRLTREGVAPGTVAYMSPEQARGEETDSRTDIWSLGVVLYEMISGRKPFKADYDAAITYSILSEAAAPLSSLRTGVPLDLERLVDRAMSKDRDERYQHADGLLADLKRIRRETGSSSEKAGTGAAPGKPAKRRKTSMITAIIVICSVAAGYLLLRPVFFDGPLVSAPVPVAVISFENQTGDPQYDYLRTVIPNLLITSLERSRYIHVATWERLQDLRKRTDSGESDIIGKELGFELCRLDGIRTIAFGSFTKAGDVFVTDIKVLDVETKELLKSASSRGRGVGSILESQIDELTREISRGIGLNERKAREVGAQIADVTTTSMEAYDYYLRGREEVYYWHIDEALESLGKAVAIDSTFAVAYLQLAEIYWNMGNMAWSL